MSDFTSFTFRIDGLPMPKGSSTRTRSGGYIDDADKKLKNGTIRLYNEKNFINELATDETCNGFAFGIFGREDGCMVINHQTGGMQAKILQRQANLNVSTVKAGAPEEQDIPLKVPQKTTLFVELTQREREYGSEMHR